MSDGAAEGGGPVVATSVDPVATEVEWQFDAPDLRPVERWLAELPTRAFAGTPRLTVLAKPPRRLVDRYLDTADWRIGRAGFVLRTRRRGRSVELTMKELRPADPAGLRRRLEITESLPSGLDALGPGGPVGRRVRAVAGTRPLVQVLEVRTRRQPFSLRADGQELAEVALDDTTIAVGAPHPPARLRRVEVEVAPGWVGALEEVVADLRRAADLRPAALSKFEAGLAACGVPVPGPPDTGPLDVPAGATLGDLAFSVVRRQLREVLAHEPGTRLGEDPEQLHDMRVATRRLRAALELFSGALPARAAALRDELAWIARQLGAVRDLDVQLEELRELAGATAHPDAAPLAHLVALLETVRDEARRGLLESLDSARWERLTAALLALARHGPGGRAREAGTPAALAVPALLDARHRATLRAARRARRTGSGEDFHRVRIGAKRLRYSVEFTAPLYGDAATRFAQELAGLQELLGTMHDAEVAAARLRSLATREAGPLGPLPAETVFVMGGIAARAARRARRLRRAAPKRLRVLGGRGWQDLRTEVDAARRRAEAATSGAGTRRTSDPG